MKDFKIDVEKLQTLSRLFSYPERWPEAGDLSGIARFSKKRWDGISGKKDLQALQGGYINLFINALPEIPCPPYGSYYLEGVLMGESTVRVKKLYHEYGFQTDELQDHIAVELEFLAFLTALPAHESVQADYDYLLDHLKQWTPAFFKQVEKSDEIGFYRDVSRYARKVIFQESVRSRELV